MTWNPSAAPFAGRLAVVGGQCRKIGKTALVVDLIRALGDLEWTAVKITPHCESGCPVNGLGCRCGPEEHIFAIREERDDTGDTDTSRYLAAGAHEAIWLETKGGQVARALPALSAAIERANHVIIESNAIVEFWQPDLFLMVVDSRKPDFKESALAATALADAFVFRSPYQGQVRLHPAFASAGESCKFVQISGQPLPNTLETLVRQRILGSRSPARP